MNKSKYIPIILLLFWLLILWFSYNSIHTNSDNWFWYTVIKLVIENNASIIYDRLLAPSHVYMSASMELIMWIKHSSVILNWICYTFILMILSIIASYSPKKMVFYIWFLLLFISYFQTTQAPWYITYIFLFITSIFVIKKNQALKDIFLSVLLLVSSIHYFTIWIILAPIPLYFLYKEWKYNTLTIKKSITYVLLWFLLMSFWLYRHFLLAWSKFYMTPFNWYITDILPFVNNWFWWYNKTISIEFFLRMWETFLTLIPLYLIPLFILLFSSKYKEHKILFYAIIFYFILNYITKVSPFDRYFLHIIAILLLIIWLNKKRKITMSSLVFFMLVFTWVTIWQPIQIYNKYKNYENLNKEVISNIKSILPNNKILDRSNALQQYLNQTIITPMFLEKNQAFNYIVWTSKEKWDVMESHDIWTIILRKPYERRQEDYYFWAEELSWKENNHVERVQNNATLISSSKYFDVYVLNKRD